jgi:IS30 family transposase
VEDDVDEELDELDDIVFEINIRPRKVLKFNTPVKVLQKALLVNGGAFRMRM